VSKFWRYPCNLNYQSFAVVVNCDGKIIPRDRAHRYCGARARLPPYPIDGPANAFIVRLLSREHDVHFYLATLYYRGLMNRNSVRLSQACFVIKSMNLPAIFFTTRKGNPRFSYCRRPQCQTQSLHSKATCRSPHNGVSTASLIALSALGLTATSVSETRPARR